MHKSFPHLNEYIFMYSAGSVFYAAAELLFRGHTHWTMVLTGGLCAALIHFGNKRLKGKGLLFRCLFGCATITAAEYAVGCLVNRLLCWNVWDYSDRFLNLHGQICPLYSLFWFILSFPAIMLSRLTADHPPSAGGDHGIKRKENEVGK